MMKAHLGARRLPFEVEPDPRADSVRVSPDEMKLEESVGQALSDFHPPVIARSKAKFICRRDPRGASRALGPPAIG